ncbi:hypothetical protein H8958_005079, partial [Nasalis larvatus]
VTEGQIGNQASRLGTSVNFPKPKFSHPCNGKNNTTNRVAVRIKCLLLLLLLRDIIHYDPTKQDHATYERKRDDKPKESKAKRKKKREEAEKLPEVSKEMYYNIAMDLKEIFQTTKYTSEKEEDTPWNEDCGKEKPEEIQDPAALTSGAEQPSGFTFSFLIRTVKT